MGRPYSTTEPTEYLNLPGTIDFLKFPIHERGKKKVLGPGIGPGSQPWQGRILPLNHPSNSRISIYFLFSPIFQIEEYFRTTLTIILEITFIKQKIV